MAARKQTFDELVEYATGKKGSQKKMCFTQVDAAATPHVSLTGPTWGEFFDVIQEADKHFARMPTLKDALKRHRRAYPKIRNSSRLERDGHVYMEVPLDGGVPIEFLKTLIDDAYAIVWNKLDASGRLKIEMAGLPYDERKLLDRLIETHGLSEHRPAIRKLARKAILLRTKKSSDGKIPVGATKIGGQPDLPGKVAWPAYNDGKPLAFIAQINLSEINTLGLPIKGLPANGLLSIFSVWGWMEKDCLDPQTPNDNTYACQEVSNWTAILHTPSRTKLERRKTPRSTNAFKAAAVEPQSILSLPNHDAEPPLTALKLLHEELDRFDQMQSDFRSLQMSHWLGISDSLASHHLLGGYALFQQEFPNEVLDKGLAMLIQIGSDRNSEMCWGDEGELTFYSAAKALAKGRFERVWGTVQGG